MASVLLRASAIVVLLGGSLLLAGSFLFVGMLDPFGMPGFNPMQTFWAWVLILGGLSISVFGAGIFLLVFASRSS